MSDRGETQQEEIVPAGEEVGGAQTEEEEEGEGAKGTDRPGEDDQIQQQKQQQQRQQHQQQQIPQGRGGHGNKVRWYKRKIRKAKNLFLLPFRKIKKFYTRTCRSAHYYYGDDPGGCCCRCLRPPPAISPPRLTDPRDPNRKNLNPSSYGFVKFLIESNDFYSPQCNVHRGISMPT